MAVLKLRTGMVRIALLLGLALTAFGGALLYPGNAVHAAPPVFDSTVDPGSRSVPENTPPGVNIGAPIFATDLDETGDEALEFGNTLTYSLSGTDAASFDIDASTGQLITKAPLDFENPKGGIGNDSNTYSVTVTVNDGDNAVTQDVAIAVTNVTTETPLAPIPPTVVSSDNPATTDTDESTVRLKVVWHPPENAGRPGIDSYAVEFKKSTETTFGTTGVGTVDGTTVVITGLESDTSYDVRVQATNSDGSGLWSLVGTGSTNKEGNSAPSFNEEDSLVERDVDENTPAGENVDGPVTATDADTTTLTYRLEGPHADFFSFDTRSGQIRTKAPLNHEDARCGYVDGDGSTECIYRVTVTVVDGAGGSDATRVHIEIDDRSEPPSAPARPTVRATDKSSTSLDVSWNAPDNMGPPITGYVVEYRKGSEAFSANGVTIIGTTATISGVNVDTPWLAPNTSYEVRVRATNAERSTGGPWSATGTGRTNRANHQPIFDERPHTDDPATTDVDESERNSAFTVSRRVDENTSSGQLVGRVFADDEDNDRLTYKLTGTHASLFDINGTNGEIRTKAGVTYNYEAITDADTCLPLDDTAKIGSDKCYTVTVEVRDGLDDDRVAVEETDPDDSITVKIGIRDRDEPPAVPTVTVTSPSANTTLVVFWDARNTGPAITHYDLQYRKGGATFSDDNCGATGDNSCTRLDDNLILDDATTISSTTIVDLEEDTSYSVQVRATNAEGTSAWSRVVTVRTNKDRENPDESNAPPVITTPTLAVDENTPSGRDIGTAVSATDDSSNSLTYSLEGRDAALFSIVSSSGQIRTKSALNHEDPACGYVAPADPADTTTCTYTVRVKVDDRAGGSASAEVTIEVNDVDEPPSAPSAPRVTATADTGWSLDVTWNEPRDTGKPPITDYDIQYRKVKSSNPDPWQLWPHGTTADPAADNTDRSAKITRRLPADTAEPLEPRTQYEVRVRAKNGEGNPTENWSAVGRGTTGASNSRPSFDRGDSVVELRVDENTRPGQNVGSAVSASDADSNTLRYSLEGPASASFNIQSSSGQIQTKSPLDFETRRSYSLTVKVDDGQGRKNSVAAKSVTITVDNVIEQPPPPAAPRVAGIPGSTDSVRVTWNPPANTGPPVLQYEVHYREAGAGLGFARWTHYGVDRSTIITGLKAGTRYEVQVRARTDEGTSEWSSSGTGMANPDVANRNPRFSGGARSLSVAENTPPNTDIGSPIAATDQDGDPLTYTLEGADSSSFDILSTSDGGQIRTSATLNHEEKSRYSLTVRVTDGRGGSDAVTITVTVTDVDGETPGVPAAPTVTGASSTSIQVTWVAPDNPGPPITDYDYRYRAASGSWTEVTNTTITGTTVTIPGLTASTSYDVEVRAINAEGTSDWSIAGIGSTLAPGANSLPVFDDGSSTTRSVRGNAPAGTNVGGPVAADDADSGDTLTYSLEGTDAASFDIQSGSGQIVTRPGITLTAGSSYDVTVVVNDGTDSARISVTITILENDGVVSLSPTTPTIGTAVTATLNDRDGGVTGLTWQWARSADGATGWANILGATAQSYTPSAADVGMYLRATATYTDAAGPNKVASSVTSPVASLDQAGTVTLSPTSADVGTALTATLSDPDGGVTGVTWQWARSADGTSGWTDIPSANSATYTPSASDVGYYLRTTATYSDAGGTGRTAMAITTAAVSGNAADTYDRNSDGSIDLDEAVAAVNDYFANLIPKTVVLEVIARYLFG